mgnify:CR=1 FL=1
MGESGGVEYGSRGGIIKIVDAVAGGVEVGSGDLEFFTRAPKAINTAIHSSLSSIEDAYRIN